MSHLSQDGHAAAGTGALGAALAINAAITVVEGAAGALTGSLALLADALHNLTDVASLALAWGGARLAARAPTPSRTFGLLRAEPIVAFVNALVLLPLSGALVYAGAHRLGATSVTGTTGPTMMALGALALVANSGSALILAGGDRSDLGTRSALLHLLADAGASAAVVLGGALTWLGVPGVDGILSIGIGLVTAKAALGLLAEAGHVLGEGAPVGAGADAVAAALRDVEGVLDVHHVHVWTISSRLRAATAHVVVSEATYASARPLLALLGDRLRDAFAIAHPTFQLETTPCRDPGVLADPRSSGSFAS